MKKITMVILITVIAAAAVFAGGNSENRKAAPGAGAGQGPLMEGAAGGTEEVTLTGTLVENDGVLALSAGEALYSLGGRGTQYYIDSFKAGDVVEVTGLLFIGDCDEDCDCDSDGHIFMERVIKDGQEYTFAGGGGYGRAGVQETRGGGRGQRNNAAEPGTGNRWSEA